MPEWYVGQTVAVISHHLGKQDVQPKLIKRVLRSFIELEDATKWCPDGGSYPKGNRGAFSRRSIQPWTADTQARFGVQEARRLCKQRIAEALDIIDTAVNLTALENVTKAALDLIAVTEEDNAN